MGKRKEPPTTINVVDETSESPTKRHKKHKKHKHKKKHDDGSGEEQIDIVQPGIKLKIKLGGQTIGSKSISSPSEKIKKSEKPSKTKPAAVLVEGDVFKTKKKGDDTSDEETEWLKALESGDLDDNGGLNKKKDPNLLTARQRSMLNGPEEGLLEIPSGYKVPDLSEEQLQKKQQRAKKRREQAQEKREKDKKSTLERLLKKQDANKGKGKGRARKSHVPGFRYLDNQTGISICVPEGQQFPFPAQTTTMPKPIVKCGVTGCGSPKKYSCSKTGVPLCSLQCYKKNLSSLNPQHTTLLVT